LWNLCAPVRAAGDRRGYGALVGEACQAGAQEAGTSPRGGRMSNNRDWNAENRDVIAKFRANGGEA